ncbi:MAG: prolyl oligopeptidase family serine peptidase, partial [Candidatus Lokiarchaeota archaeon]|nr:prolyl oligopeptidase family serine peptidase [Candidatus Lokiarchaeota archaeon]
VYRWGLNKGYSEIGTIGLSFGGITSLVAQLPERKVAVFWAPAFYFTKVMSFWELTFAKIGAKLFPNLTIKRDSKNNEPILITGKFMKEMMELDTDAYLCEFNTPSLLIQGTADDRIGPKNNYQAFSRFPKDKHHKLIKVEGATHDFDGAHLDEFISHTMQWIKRYM